MLTDTNQTDKSLVTVWRKENVLGAFTVAGTKINFGSRKVNHENYSPTVHIDGVSHQINGMFKHAKTAWRRAKKEAKRIWLRMTLRRAINKPANLNELRTLIGGDVPVYRRLTPLNYESFEVCGRRS